METKEFEFKGMVFNGFLMLFVNLLLTIVSMTGIVFSFLLLGGNNGGGWSLGFFILMLIAVVIMWCGHLQLEPNEARVATWFGKYAGTFSQTGFYWINPFYGTKKVSLRARNLDAEPIKVNDKTGNPVMIGLVLVWKLKDTYKALFEVDTQTMASVQGQVGTDMRSVMNALERFVRVQSDAALRQVAGQYAYDDEDNAPMTVDLPLPYRIRTWREVQEEWNERFYNAGPEDRVSEAGGAGAVRTECPAAYADGYRADQNQY
jgi:hypothetical protein